MMEGAVLFWSAGATRSVRGPSPYDDIATYSILQRQPETRAYVLTELLSRYKCHDITLTVPHWQATSDG